MEDKIQKIRDELKEERRQTLIRLERLDNLEKEFPRSAEEIACFNREKNNMESEVRQFGEHLGLTQDTIDFIVKTQVRPGAWFGHDSGFNLVETYLRFKKEQFYSSL